MLAPTAINQQNFMLALNSTSVEAKSFGGLYSKVDLDIVKYHFQVGSGKENFTRK